MEDKYHKVKENISSLTDIHTSHLVLVDVYGGTVRVSLSVLNLSNRGKQNVQNVRTSKQLYIGIITRCSETYNLCDIALYLYVITFSIVWAKSAQGDIFCIEMHNSVLHVGMAPKRNGGSNHEPITQSGWNIQCQPTILFLSLDENIT